MDFGNYMGMPREFMLGNFVSALAIGMAIAFGIVFYVYFAIAWQKIARDQKYKKHWLAWIPFANVSMILQMGGFSWAWIFLILVPFAGWVAIGVLSIISQWRIFEKAKYPGWFSLSSIIPKVGFILYVIVIGFVAWSKRVNQKISKPTKKKPRKK